MFLSLKTFGRDALAQVSNLPSGHLRRFLVVGIASVPRPEPTAEFPPGARVRSLRGPKPTWLVTVVAIFNKTAQAALALLANGESCEGLAAI